MATRILGRHAQALSQVTTDLARTLSAHGVVQGRHKLQQLVGLGLREVDLLVHSPAERARETAALIVPSYKNIIVDDNMYALVDHPDGDEAYDKLGAKATPLEWKQQYPHLWTACENYAENSYEIAEASPLEVVAFVGHGTALNALALKYVKSDVLKELIMDFAFPECGVMIIADETILFCP